MNDAPEKCPHCGADWKGRYDLVEYGREMHYACGITRFRNGQLSDRTTDCYEREIEGLKGDKTRREAYIRALEALSTRKDGLLYEARGYVKERIGGITYPPDKFDADLLRRIDAALEGQNG